MIENLTFFDKLIIYLNAGLKLCRGFWKRLFLKNKFGFLFVGKSVSITHGHHIQCGKNVKFESFSEIQGLCSDGLIFEDGVTIGKNVSIRPSSYYGIDMGRGLKKG